MPNALKELNRYGQSVWLDYIRRSLITSGELRRLLDEDGLRGVTMRPSPLSWILSGLWAVTMLAFVTSLFLAQPQARAALRALLERLNGV